MYNEGPLYASPEISPDTLVMEWNNGFRGEEVQQYHHHHHLHRGAAYEPHAPPHQQPMSICKFRKLSPIHRSELIIPNSFPTSPAAATSNRSAQHTRRPRLEWFTAARSTQSPANTNISIQSLAAVERGRQHSGSSICRTAPWRLGSRKLPGPKHGASLHAGHQPGRRALQPSPERSHLLRRQPFLSGHDQMQDRSRGSIQRDGRDLVVRRSPIPSITHLRYRPSVFGTTLPHTGGSHGQRPASSSRSTLVRAVHLTTVSDSGTSQSR